MRVSCINAIQKSIVHNNYSKNNSLFFNKRNNSSDVFVKKSNSLENKLSFRGLPYSLYIKQQNEITGDEAFEYFQKLSLGNYLDLNGDSKDEKAREIRKKNLSFLDKVKDVWEKDAFIEKYCEHTGFPDMQKVSSNIKNAFVDAVSTSKNIIQRQYGFSGNYVNFNVIGFGYDGISSVSRNTAFPGSDLDKAYVILQGNDDDSSNEITVQNFKAELWDNTDQTILSYNHDAVSFPEVYTVKQINAMCEAINKAVEKMDLFSHKKVTKSKPHLLFFTKTYEEVLPSKYDEYKKLTTEYSEDYVKANKFVIDLARQFKPNYSWDKAINVENPSREDIYKACFVIESILHGKTLSENKVELPIDKKVGDLINLSQIQALKNSTFKKEKYEKRLNMETAFNSWHLNQQFEFIKSMIKASCSDNTAFPHYYKTKEEDRFQEVIKAIGLGK